MKLACHSGRHSCLNKGERWVNLAIAKQHHMCQLPRTNNGLQDKYLCALVQVPLKAFKSFDKHVLFRLVLCSSRQLSWPF